jgi:hypothetical protein
MKYKLVSVQNKQLVANFESDALPRKDEHIQVSTDFYSVADVIHTWHDKGVSVVVYAAKIANPPTYLLSSN